MDDIRGYGATGGVYRVASVGAGTLQAQMDVMGERLDQLEEFTRDADDLLEPSEWIARLAKHTGRAVTFDPQEFRREMVVVGALALAAIESFDRRYSAETT